MAKTSIIYLSSSGRASSLELDAVLARDSERGVEVTRFPIEDGSAISDHAIRLPDVFHLSGLFTDYPMATKEEIDSGKYADRARMARDELERILADKRTVTVESGGRSYSDLVMVGLRFGERGGDESTRTAVRFDAEFEKVVKVATETVALPASKPATTSGGKKPTEKATEPVKRKASAYKKTADYLRGKKG